MSDHGMLLIFASFSFEVKVSMGIVGEDSTAGRGVKSGDPCMTTKSESNLLDYTLCDLKKKN